MLAEWLVPLTEPADLEAPVSVVHIIGRKGFVYAYPTLQFESARCCDSCCFSSDGRVVLQHGQAGEAGRNRDRVVLHPPHHHPRGTCDQHWSFRRVGPTRAPCRPARGPPPEQPNNFGLSGRE